MKTSTGGRQQISRPMTTKAVARIYSATARQNNGSIPANSFAARAAAAAAHNATVGKPTDKPN
jgi:hypothetical protein